MKRIIACAALVAALSGCSLFTAKNAKTALDASQVACALAASFGLTSQEVAAACKVDATLAPALEQLLAGKARAGAARCVTSSSTVPR